MSQIDHLVYQAAHETAVIAAHPRRGMLLFRGQGRLDLIDRMSTQKVRDLKGGQGLATVFITDIGRMIDRVILYATSESVYCLTGEEHNTALGRYLMSKVFFNDDFHLQDLTNETAVWGIYGPQAKQFLEKAGFTETDLPLHHWRQATLGTITAYIHATDPIAGGGYFVTATATDQEPLYRLLLSTGLVPADEAAYDLLRIENGRPRFRCEITLDYIPLEADLWEDVSFNKGCYVGQEIIARMESRGKIARQLVKLQPPAPVAPGDTILLDGTPVGKITSAAIGPHGPLALGYVKTAVLANTPTFTFAAN